MVELQERDEGVPVWGWKAPGTSVRVRFRDQDAIRSGPPRHLATLRERTSLNEVENESAVRDRRISPRSDRGEDHDHLHHRHHDDHHRRRHRSRDDHRRRLHHHRNLRGVGAGELH